MVEVVTPSAVIEVVPLMLEFAATAAVGANTTVPPVRATGVKRDKVLVSATVEDKWHVECPVASLDVQAP